MDVAKKQRTVQRTLFTKCLNVFVAKCNNATVTADDRHVALQMLETRVQELENANAKYIELLSNEAVDDDVLVKEIESHDEYQKKFLEARVKYLSGVSATRTGNSEFGANQQVHRSDKPYKCPTLEVPKYPGGVHKWLQFWSHFRKYHEDPVLSKEDKLEYLKGMMAVDSKAFVIVHGFPTTAENYDSAFESLKDRYGRDDLLIEYYTRELLTLAIQNATKKKEEQSDIASIYDRLSAHIRALDTLGVKTDNCATMLYPLVESSLPEEILRTWQRSPLSSSTNNGNQGQEGAPVSDRLTKLLEFLKTEVTNEERINMAVTHFAVASDKKKEKPKEGKQKENKGTSSKEPATASALLSSEHKGTKCVFCGESHGSANCEEAKKMSFEDRKKIMKDKNCCFKCLIPNHRSKNCKVKIICGWCGNRYHILVCRELNKDKEPSDPSERKNDATVKSSRPEQTLASFCSAPDVYLQTLRVVIYSDTREKVARVVVDQGSQRSYIRSDAAKFLGYQPVGKREVTHALFGRVKSDTQVHNLYSVRMRSLDDTYACNFQVMDEKTICADIPRIKRVDWLDDLKKHNISLSDLEADTTYSDNSIDVLIGADIAGKLFTGKKYDLENGITAFESRLGWMIMGRAPSSKREDCTLNVVSMFVNEAKVSNLWELDLLGIRDPIEKGNELAREQTIRENFMNTVSYKDERYSVDLPWDDDHPPVSSNFELCKSRLESTVKKL
ncbi:uncharacterized protein LOC131670472 [Phymastichus coffea]|uniref:uncharacterized protein LOC131670472 n=1 Tax=Phymastichus coffea TaxID=108790 RepID=UPI00273B3ACA|nr:uncharacterized protein LOC131670472 [Phymastichus coffea]